MSETFDTLKQPDSNPTDFSAFTDEQTDAVVLYLAKLARETRDEHGMTDAQKIERHKKFFAIMDSWPDDFRVRVMSRVISASTAKNTFWAVPADAMIAATKAVELT